MRCVSILEGARIFIVKGVLVYFIELRRVHDSDSITVMEQKLRTIDRHKWTTSDGRPSRTMADRDSQMDGFTAAKRC